jgi:type IV pilus assembly protein PilB
MTTSRLRLGQLLVDAGLITQEALEDVLAAQKQDGRRLGTLLVERGHISEVQLTQILSHQLSVPWVSLLKTEFSRQLLNLVPRETAEKYCLLPIYVRRVRGQGDVLYLAMEDPTNEEALKACSAHAGLAARPMIAPPGDIRNAIRVYYGGPTAETEPPPPLSQPSRSNVPTAPAPAAVPAEASASGPISSRSGDDAQRTSAVPPERTSAIPPERTSAIPPERASTPSPSAEASANGPPSSRPGRPSRPPSSRRSPRHDEPGPTIEITAVHTIEVPPTKREAAGPTTARSAKEDPDVDVQPPPSERPAPIPSPRGKAPRMLSLTLLDGTTISLPARAQKRPPEPASAAVAERKSELPPEPASLTARDLVTALRAVAHGADASAILGEDVRWETMFAALLSLLMKKGVIADWEFVEELHKLTKR